VSRPHAPSSEEQQLEGLRARDCESGRSEAPGNSVLALFADLGSLADAISQVVQLGAADVATDRPLHLGHDRRVHGERSFHTNTEAELADLERLVDAGATAGNDNAFEDLDAFFIALDDTHVHLDRVSSLEFGNVVPKALLVDEIGDVHRVCSCVIGQLGQRLSLGRVEHPYNVTDSSKSEGEAL